MEDFQKNDSGVLGTLLSNNEAPSLAPSAPVIVPVNSPADQLQMPLPSLTTPITSNTPLVIGLVSSGPETKATLTMPVVKSVVPSPKVTSTPLAPDKSHATGKPRAIFSMMSEPKTPSVKKQQLSKKGSCVCV